MADVLFDSEPGVITLSGSYALNISGPPPSWNPNLDYTYWCDSNKVNGVGQGVGVINLSGSATRLEVYIPLSPGIITLSGSGILPSWVLINSSPGIITLIGKGTPWLIPTGASWVKWADKNGIFDMNKSNLAGERPMEFGDILYQSKKLGNSIVIYGKNGVAIMTPAGLMWQLKTLLRVGLKSKNAVTGNEDVHYFLDREGILWELQAGGGLQMHDYSNHLSVLGNKTVMSYDERKKLVYITDGTYGFVYSQAGLGKCPINITGMGYKGGTYYVVGSATIANTPIQIETDIWDGGTRHDKEIQAINVGTDVAQDLFGAIKYRWNKAQTFNMTPWTKADYGGIVHLRASGVEFKFCIKLDTYAFLRLDYINLKVLYSELKPLMVGNA